MNPRRSLSEILTDNDRNTLKQAWSSTQAADDLRPLPPGEYIAHVLSGELDTARTGTLGYKLTFSVIEGEYAGRRFWHDIWLTPAALPMAKRDLLKLGITDLDQLEKPLPQGIRVKARLVLRRDDDGGEHNRVRTFDVVGIDAPEADAFAPDATAADASGDTAPAAGDQGGDEGGNEGGDGGHRDLFPQPGERVGLPDAG